ncbi:hypothetical protein GCM10009570_22570 [Dietzia natronolimnaea]
MDTIMGYMRDIQISMTAIARATGAAKVNVAILGNRDPHVHAHLVPRFPQEEEYPDCSPWNDRRPKGQLDDSEVRRIKELIYKEIEYCDSRRQNDEYPSLF